MLYTYCLMSEYFFHLILFLDFSNSLINKCTKLEPEGDFPELRETLDHFKVIILFSSLLNRIIEFIIMKLLIIF